jgi:vitamin B12 transporter
MRKHYLMVVTGLISSTLAFAQDSLKTTVLQEVITSASRFEQPIIEVPRSVTVINRQVIEKSIYNSVGELLSKQSGIYVVGANQTPGTNQSLFMRGANSNQVAIMIDGTRITDPSSPNAATDLSEISLTDIERIEIIRGSHSTMYGGAAVGGVVNIITRKGARTGFSGNIGLQGGIYSKGSSALTNNLSLNYALQNGLYFNISSMNQNVSGLNASIDTLKESGVYKTTDKDGFVKNDVFLKAGFKNEKLDVFASYKKVNQRADLDKGTYSDDDNAYLDFERNLISYNVAYNFTKNWKASVLGSWSDSERQNVNDSSVSKSDGTYDGNSFRGVYNGGIQTNELQFNADYGKVKGVIGGGLFSEKMNFNTYYYSSAFEYESKVNYDTLDTSAKTRYVFAEVRVALDNFNLSLGSRYSNHSLFGTSVTYEINPSYKVNNFLFYGSLSTGFNPASLYQLYDPTRGFGAYRAKGNKDLDAEKSMSVELGIKKEFASGNYFTVSAFQTKTTNAIEYVYLWNKNTPIQDLSYLDYLGDTYLNVSKQIVTGIEIDGHAEFRKFYLNANISAIKGEVTISPEDINVDQTGGHHVQLFNYGSFITDEIKIEKLVRRPKVNGYAEIGYKPLTYLTVNIAYRHAGARNDVGYDANLGPFGALNQFNVKQYSLVDVGVSWQIIKNISVAFKAENIFNENYQEILGYQTRGRSAYIKLNVRW